MSIGPMTFDFRKVFFALLCTADGGLMTFKTHLTTVGEVDEIFIARRSIPYLYTV